MKKYEVTCNVEGSYTWTGEAESYEEAEELATNDSYEVDLGILDNITWEIYEINEVTEE